MLSLPAQFDPERFLTSPAPRSRLNRDRQRSVRGGGRERLALGQTISLSGDVVMESVSETESYGSDSRVGGRQGRSYLGVS